MLLDFNGIYDTIIKNEQESDRMFELEENSRLLEEFEAKLKELGESL